MPCSVFSCISYTKLIPRLLGQQRRMAISRSWGRLGLTLLHSLSPPDLLLAGRRSQPSDGPSPCTLWVLSHRRPSERRSSSARASAPLSLCWPLRGADSLHSADSRSKHGKMSAPTSSSSSSSSAAAFYSTNNGQGKKTKSPFRKRGSLQSATTPGE